jgi:chemotaxis family two-component system sensor kinase Cph1
MTALPRRLARASPGALPGPRVDLTNCDREPIHLPGSIQPHGFLLALAGSTASAAELRVAQASASAASFLVRPIETILERRLGDLLSDQAVDRLSRHLQDERQSAAAEFAFAGLVTEDGAAGAFEVVCYRSGSLLVLEFDAEGEALDVDALNAEVYSVIKGIPGLATVTSICTTAARALRRLTGFDRALLYCFDEDGTGIVLAEDRNDLLPSYLNLRFPASDIPQQARRLYTMNRVRIIPDVDYIPSPLVAAVMADEAAAGPLDLSGSILRSVSPVHRDYMRNMGTAASMSISIVIDGQLWGLISLHHHAVRHVPYRVRAACDLLTQFFSAQLTAEIRSARLTRTAELRGVQRRLLTQLATAERYLHSLTDAADDLLELTGAQGAALVLGDECTCVGVTPPELALQNLTRWLKSRGEWDSFATSALPREYPEAAPWAESASGVLAISISHVHRSYLLWFRPELREAVHWAGEPAKGMRSEEGRLEIHPRHSFHSWQEIVRGKAQPWTGAEIEAAGELRAAILQIVLRRAEEMANMAAELEVANKELEAFSYSVSHDLRAPFRHISGFSELLMEEERDRLSERGVRYIKTIMESARFAGLLVDTLLNFSRIGRSKIEQVPVRMDDLLMAAWGDVQAQEADGRSIQFTHDQLPVVRGDLNLLRQVLRNLLSNAVKYSRNRAEARIHVGVEQRGGEYIFSVRDNGVGFDQQYAHKLFGVFQRLHRAEEFEGTGIGLANIRRIVTRHGGRTYAEGVLGEGATFYFTLPVREEGMNAETNSAG